MTASSTRLPFEALSKIFDKINFGDLERLGCYPQDVKCGNLNQNLKLYLIDLGCGLTPGMCRPEAELRHFEWQMAGRDMLHTLGRTVPKR